MTVCSNCKKPAAGLVAVCPGCCERIAVLEERLRVYEEDPDVSDLAHHCACTYWEDDTLAQECRTHGTLRRNYEAMLSNSVAVQERIAVLERIRDAAVPVATWAGCCRCGPHHRHQCQDLRALRAVLNEEGDGQ